MLDLRVSTGLPSHCYSLESMSALDSSRCWDSPKSDRKKDHMSRNHIDVHREHHSSANDPALQSGREDKSVLSNSRPHPRAELKEGSSKHSSNHLHNHVSNSSSSRKRKNDSEKDDEDDVWAEHKSSSGRIYYYNKRLDKSQWEKPTKGTIKKLKSESHSSKSSSSQSSSHSKSHSSTSKHHHHSTSNSSNSRHSSSSKSRDDKTSSSSAESAVSTQQHKSVLTPSSTATTVMTSPSTTPINSRLSNMVSPLPQPSASPLTPSVLPQYSATPENPLLAPQVAVTTPYSYGGGGTDPNGLIQMGWGGGVVNTPNSGMHPLQHTVIQYSQGYPLQHSMTPPFMIPQGAHTPSGIPLAQSAPATPPSMGVYPSRRLLYQDHQPSCSSKTLQKPMSLLGVRSKMEHATQDFPDPSSLKPLTQPPSNELYSRVLAELIWWTPPLDQCCKQMDQTHNETLSRTTVDTSYHCGQLAKNLLSLECCRIKTVSRTARITELHNLMDAIEKR